MAFVPPLGIRATVAESLIHDLGRVSEWCDLWGMKLNAFKIKSMIVSRSCTMHPQSLPLTIGGTVLKQSDDLVPTIVNGVTEDALCITWRPSRSIFAQFPEQLLKDLVS